METYLIKEAKGAEKALVGHIDACKRSVNREVIKAKLDVERRQCFTNERNGMRQISHPLTTRGGPPLTYMMGRKLIN